MIPRRVVAVCRVVAAALLLLVIGAGRTAGQGIDAQAMERLALPLVSPQTQSPTYLAVRASGTDAQERVDRWIAEDKVRHFFMSYASAAFAFAALRSAGIAHEPALPIALAAGAAAGVGKELHDRRRGAWFSGRDLVADALGLAAAFFMLREID